MLDLCVELSEDVVRDVTRILCDEVDADTLGADKLYDLLDLVEQSFGGAAEEQMCLIEEEHHLRLVKIADLWQGLKEFGEHPQEECGIETAVIDQGLAVQNADHTLAVTAGCEPVMNIDTRFTEELVAAFGLKSYDGAEHCADGILRDVAVLGGKLLIIIAHVIEQGFKVLGVNKKQILVIRNLESNGHKVCLQVIEVQNSGKKRSAHLGNCCAERNTVLAKQIIEGRRIAVIVPSGFLKPELLDSSLHVLTVFALEHCSREVALDVGEEYRDTEITE